MWTTKYRDDSYLERDWDASDSGNMLYCYECEHCVDGCDGKRCKTCNGRGVVDGPGCVQIDGRRISNRYFHLVSQLPDVRFEFSRKRLFREHVARADTSEAVRFAFRGGVGLVMPIMEDAT